MVYGFSCGASLLVRIWNAALDSAAASGSSTAQPNRPLPGRMTIRAPAKPPATRVQRNADTRSFSHARASSVTSSGVSITIAVNSATGMWRRALKAIADANISSAPRKTWKRGLAVRKVLSRDSAIHAVIASVCIA